MSSTHDPAAEDDGKPRMDLELLLEALDGNASSLQTAIRSVEEAAEPGEQLPRSEVDSVRTEVIELQAAVEELLTQHCEDATPWEYAGEHVPAERLDEFTGAA